MTTGSLIRQLRQQKGYSQENLADMLGLSTTAYGDIERGKTDLTLSRLYQIAKALGTTVQQLVSPELPLPQELYPTTLIHQLETLQLERAKQEIEIQKLQLEVAHWKRLAEEQSVSVFARPPIPRPERPRIGFK